jgi:two-component system, OmpR family, sensor histidine kinase QseC
MQYRMLLPMRNLAFRLIVTFVASLLLLIMAINVYIFVLNPNVLLNRIMEEQVNNFISSVHFDERGSPAGLHLDVDSEWIYSEFQKDLFYQIVDVSGMVLVASGSSRIAFSPDGKVFDPSVEKFHFMHNGLRLYAVNQPLQYADSDYYLQVATSDRLLDIFEFANIRPIFHTALAISLISLVLVSGIVVVTIKYMLKPLRDASQIASSISPSNLQGRLPIDKVPTELEPLIHAFNAALERLENGYKVQQELLATTAHELKTPLTLIRGEIEMSDGLESRDMLLSDIDQITRQVHQLLHLAEVRESHNYQLQVVEVNEVVSEVIIYLARFAKANGVAIDHMYTSDQIYVSADRSALFILIKNLIENSINHSPQGAAVSVRMGAKFMEVRDQGCGVLEEHFPLLFNKFWRAPMQQGGGAGLGLAICKEITQTHKWEISASNTGHGASFRVSFTAVDSTVNS